MTYISYVYCVEHVLRRSHAQSVRHGNLKIGSSFHNVACVLKKKRLSVYHVRSLKTRLKNNVLILISYVTGSNQTGKQRSKSVSTEPLQVPPAFSGGKSGSQVSTKSKADTPMKALPTPGPRPRRRRIESSSSSSSSSSLSSSARPRKSSGKHESGMSVEFMKTVLLSMQSISSTLATLSKDKNKEGSPDFIENSAHIISEKSSNAQDGGGSARQSTPVHLENTVGRSARQSNFYTE